MKFFAFFMAIIVLALSFMPCADEAMTGKIAKVEFSKSSHQQDSPQRDDCSPLCHCSCCASYSVVKFVSFHNSIPIMQNKGVAAYLPSSVLEISLPIWQPPQLIS